MLLLLLLLLLVVEVFMLAAPSFVSAAWFSIAASLTSSFKNSGTGLMLMLASGDSWGSGSAGLVLVRLAGLEAMLVEGLFNTCSR